jgi:Bacterial conjugation TrbI-like protein
MIRPLQSLWASLALVFALVLIAPVHAQEGPATNAQAAQAAPQNAASSAAAPTTTGAADPNTAVPVRAKRPQIEVPKGTHIPLVLHNGISTRTAHTGDPVYFQTMFPVVVNERIVIPSGTYVSGEVTESKRPGRVKGRGEIMVRLTTMIFPNGYIVSLEATPSSADPDGRETVNSEGKIVRDSSKGRDAGTVIGTTVAGTELGTVVGAASGNIGRGAALGAGAGAIAGLGTVLLTRGPDAELRRGQTLEAVTDRPLYLDADKAQFTSPGQTSVPPAAPNRVDPRPYPYRSPIPY